MSPRYPDGSVCVGNFAIIMSVGVALIPILHNFYSQILGRGLNGVLRNFVERDNQRWNLKRIQDVHVTNVCNYHWKPELPWEPVEFLYRSLG